MSATEDKVAQFLNKSGSSLAGPNDKVAQFLANRGPSSFARTKITATERFAEGVGRGIIYPIRSFLPDTEGSSTAIGRTLQNLREPDEEGGIAGTVGELVGMGVSFIPLFKGAQVVTGGIGILASAPRLARVVEGSTSFAAFEAFAGESPSEAPKRALVGLAEGAAFEVGLMGVAKAWRSRFPRPKTPLSNLQAIDEEIAATVAKTGDVGFDSLALKIERWFAPSNETMEQTIEKLRAVQDPEANLYQAVARITKQNMPGGYMMLPTPDLGEGQRVLKIAKELGYKTAQFIDTNGPEGYQVINLLVDTEKKIFNLKEGSALARKVYGSGEPVLSFDEGVELIAQLGGDLAGDVLTFPGRLGNEAATVMGYFNPETNAIVIGHTATRTNQQLLSTLVHEFTHRLHYAESRRLGMASDETLTIGEIFKQFRPIGRPGGNIATIRQELIAVTAELSRRFMPNETRESLIQLFTDPAKRTNLSTSSKNWVNYAMRDKELIARMVELMFLDPAMAKKIAPRASRLTARYIERNSPEMKELMTKSESVFDDYMRELWSVKDGRLTVWTAGKPLVTERDLRQFGKEGWFKGMTGFVDGKEVTVLRKIGDKFEIRRANGGTGKIPASSFSRPLVTEVLKRDATVLAAIDGMLSKTPRSVGVNIILGDGQKMTRGVVNLEGFQFLSTAQMRRWMQELTDVERTLYTEATQIAGNDAGVRALIQSRGLKGLAVVDDHLDMTLYMGDDKALTLGEQASTKFLRPNSPANDAESIRLKVGLDDTLRSLLREEGVLEHDIDYFLNLTKDRLGHRLNEYVDLQTKLVNENIEAQLASSVDESLESVVTRSGLEASDEGGDLVLRDRSSKSLLGVFSDEREAIAYSKRSGLADASEEVSFPGANNAGGNAPPPPPQAQFPAGMDDIPIRPNKWTRFSDAQTLGVPIFGARENFAKTAERLGYGPVYNKIFLPLQKAILRVDEQMAEVKRDLLGGISFTEGIQKLSRSLSQVPRKLHPKISQYVEALSKEEIASVNGLLPRGMTANEIRVADAIEKMNLGHDIPRLMTTERLIQSALEGQPKLDSTIRMLQGRELNPDTQQLLTLFDSLPKFTTRDEVVKFLGLTEDEKQVIKIITDSMAADKDKFSIMAVGRYATAKRGNGKTGRELFAVEHGLGKNEIKAAEQIDELLNAVFGMTGMDAKRQIGGYFPHMRLWAKEGWNPKMMEEWGTGLPKDFVDWAHDMFRTGEVDIYNLDPLITTYKYVRSLLMKQEMDPLLPEAIQALAQVKDKRVFEVMSEYINELKGVPHESFGNLQKAIQKTWSTLTGREVPETLVRNVIHSLSSLATSSMILFRPAVILRNYYETLQKVAPRMGFDYYSRALRYVSSPETRKEAYEGALAAFAIEPRIQHLRSVHAAEDLFGPLGSKWGYKYQLIVDKGSKWYQSADDWGRALAFHAQRFRFFDEYGKYQKGLQSFDKFLENAKIFTYDPLDVQNAEKMLKAGQVNEAADYLGWIFARESMVRYGHANSPAGWNSVTGKMLGQFGTWPVQYKDFLVQGLSRGTSKDRAGFAAAHFGVMGATVLAGQAVGVNLSGWTAFPSLAYTGGPIASMGVDAVKSISGSDLEKSLARRNLVAQVPILGWMETGSPRSMFIPGSYLLGDLVDASQADGLLEATLEGGGFRLIRPTEKTAFERLMDF